MNKPDYKMALGVLSSLEANQNTPHIMAGIVFAKAATKKQIEKRVKINGAIFECPSCGKHGNILYGDKFCVECGQALDWGISSVSGG